MTGTKANLRSFSTENTFIISDDVGGVDASSIKDKENT